MVRSGAERARHRPRASRRTIAAVQSPRTARTVGPDGAADPFPDQSAARVERQLCAVWRRRLQRRFDHSHRACRRAIRSTDRRHSRKALSLTARTPATRPNQANRSRLSRSTTKPSSILRIASYKKVRDAAVAVMTHAYGIGPTNLYFIGSSEGGREALTMAQRYPDDFDGIFARVPVINWAGLQHASTRSACHHG